MGTLWRNEGNRSRGGPCGGDTFHVKAVKLVQPTTLLALEVSVWAILGGSLYQTELLIASGRKPNVKALTIKGSFWLMWLKGLKCMLVLNEAFSASSSGVTRDWGFLSSATFTTVEFILCLSLWSTPIPCQPPAPSQESSSWSSCDSPPTLSTGRGGLFCSISCWRSRIHNLSLAQTGSCDKAYPIT